MQVQPELARKLALQSGKMQDRVTLPCAPSANNLFITIRKTGRRVKSPDYRKWLDEVVPALAFLNAPVAYPCQYHILLAGKVNVLRDGANVEKATIDACVKALVIPDDSLKYIRRGFWEWAPGKDEPTVTVWFTPLMEV